MTIPADAAGHPDAIPFTAAIGGILFGFRWLRDWIWPAVEVTNRRHPRPNPRIVRAGINVRSSGPPPTASPVRVDLSPVPSRASAVDREAFDRTEPCVCGGLIVATWPDVAGVVLAHNGSLLHAVWHKRMFADEYWRAAA